MIDEGVGGSKATGDSPGKGMEERGFLTTEKKKLIQEFAERKKEKLQF